MIDLHTHILPQIDDGAKSIEESLELIDSAEKLGIDFLACTPHFYSDTESITNFKNRRDYSYTSLKKSCDSKLKIVKGVEVFVTDFLFYQKNITSLLIENTPFMLVEFEGKINEITLGKWLHNFARLNITPIIAHIERYSKLHNLIKLFKEFGCLISVNYNSFFHKLFSKNIKYLIEHNLVDFLTSDAHNIGNRGYPTQDEYNQILDMLSEKQKLHIQKSENKILSYYR